LPRPPAVSSPQATTAGPPSRRPHHFRDAGLEYVLAVPAGSIQRLTAGAVAFKVSASSSFAASRSREAPSRICCVTGSISVRSPTKTKYFPVHRTCSRKRARCHHQARTSIHRKGFARRSASKCQGKWPNQTPRPSVRVTRGVGSGQHLASVLQERRENANIDAGLGFIWRISDNYWLSRDWAWRAGRCSR